MPLLLLIGFCLSRCSCSTPVVLEVAPGTTVNDPLPLAALSIGMRRFALADCVALPAAVTITGSRQNERRYFAFDQTARNAGADGVLRDTDLLSGVGGLSNDSTVAVEFGRNLTAEDFVVVVDVNTRDPFSVQAPSSSGSLLRIDGHEYGADVIDTGAPRLVPSSRDPAIRLSMPHAVAFNLADLGVTDAISKVLIVNADGLDLTFVGLVNSLCLLLAETSSTTMALPATLPPVASSNKDTTMMATVLSTTTTSMGQITTTLAMQAPVAIVAGSAIGAIVLFLAVIGLVAAFVCSRRRQSDVGVDQTRPVRTSEYASTSLMQRVRPIENQYEPVSAPLTL